LVPGSRSFAPNPAFIYNGLPVLYCAHDSPNKLKLKTDLEKLTHFLEIGIEEYAALVGARS